MAKQPYVHVDWRKIETVREGVAKGSSITLGDLNARNPQHRTTLLALSPAERTKLVKLDGKLAGEVSIAGAFLCGEKKLAEGLGLFDHVAAAGHPVEKVELTAGVNATYWLLEAPAALKTHERARRYVDYFRTIGTKNTAILLNIALIERDILANGKGAIATLREAIELGDPRIRKQIEGEDAAWKALPGFAALRDATPQVPVGLRCLQTWYDLSDDAVTTMYSAGLAYFDLGFEKWKLSDTFHGVDDASFEVFAQSEEGARWALWRRDRKASRERSPVVVFGPQGSIGVYAASVVGMLCLFANGWKSSDVEAIGYPYGDDGWIAPKKLRALKPQKTMMKRLAEIDPAAMKLDPEKERKKALALMPDFIAEATRRGKTSAVRTPNAPAAAKKPAKKSTTTYDVGFANVPTEDLPPDLAFLQSKEGKAWLRTFEVRLLSGKGKRPELLEDLPNEEDEDPETIANLRAIREVLAMVTFAVEAPQDNAKLYGYWRGPEKTPLSKAPIVGYDSEGTISREVGASLIEVLLQESTDEEEVFMDRKTKLEKAGMKIATKRWNDFTSRAKWKTDPEKLHSKLYEKYRKEK